MTFRPLPLAAGVAGGALALALLAATPQESGGQMPSAADMADMMKKAQQYTAPGENHQLLRRFLGTWDTRTRMTMPGMQSPPETGRVEGSWLIDGRWLQLKGSGSMMGMPVQSVQILGYDNLKMSYVSCMVQSMDTMMLTAEGDLNMAGDALISYGTMDEYLTGEHDKMAKTVFRFPSADRLVMEIHDLGIGEVATKVVEITYTR